VGERGLAEQAAAIAQGFLATARDESRIESSRIAAAGN